VKDPVWRKVRHTATGIAPSTGFFASLRMTVRCHPEPKAKDPVWRKDVVILRLRRRIPLVENVNYSRRAIPMSSESFGLRPQDDTCLRACLRA